MLTTTDKMYQKLDELTQRNSNTQIIIS